MKPKFDHRVIRPQPWVPAASTDISKTIARERRRLAEAKEAQALADAEAIAKTTTLQIDWRKRG